MVTFEQVVDHFGGTHESLAKALGISREAVTMWRGQIPESRAFQIEVVSGGKFKAADLLKLARESVA
jgi:hypothetical protein